MTQSRKRSLPVAGAKSIRSAERYSSGIWWLLSFLLLISIKRVGLMSKVTILPFAAQPHLSSDEYWSSPFMESWDLNLFSHWPWFVVAMVGAACVAVLCRYVSRFDSHGTSLLAIVTLSLGFQEVHLIPAILLIGIRVFHDCYEEGKYALQALMIALMLLFAGVLITLEFGLLIFFWFALLLSHLLTPYKNSRRELSLWGAGAVVMALLFATAFLSGFSATLLRSVNWHDPPVSATLVESLSPVSFEGKHRWRDLFAVLSIGAFWCHSGRTVESMKKGLPFLIPFSLLGLLCVHYLWLSSAVLALRPRPFAKPGPITRSHTLGVIAILLFCMMKVGGPISFLRESLTTDPAFLRQLDPSKWSTEGRVVLMDLDRSHEWQSPELREHFQLVLDNRWEFFEERHSEYASVCDDLREMRSGIYFKPDDQFGGYLQRIRSWDAALLVLDSADLQAIRNLSLSPHWSLMGIDSESTIFGRSDLPANHLQIERVRRAFLALEWPHSDSLTLPPNVIAASPSSVPRVAAVLNAIRLPYAAMRLLPKSYHLNCEKVRARCYLELAHRCYRNTGSHSLLDQSRAIELIRSVERKISWPREEKESLIRGLNSLGIDGLSNEVFPGQLSESERTDDNPGGLSSFLERPESERRMRELILRGQTRAARQQLLNLSEDVRPFYALLMDSDGRSPEELAYLLHKQSQQPKFSERLLPECLFYIGCLAIEAGDPEVAIQAISASEHRAPGSHLTPLRVMYLKQLQRP